MASILEQYESSVCQTTTQISSNINNSHSLLNEGIINLRSDQMEPIFVKNKVDFTPSYPITHVVVSNNQLLLSMENLHLLKIDLMNPSKRIEIDLNTYLPSTATSISKQRPVIGGLFIDPTGYHCLISVALKSTDGSGDQLIPCENFYFHRKISLLQKTKGHLITAVGWMFDQQLLIYSNGPNQQQQPSCGNILLGTIDGRIFEAHFQPSESDRFLQTSRELTFWKFVCDLSPASNNDPQQHQLQSMGSNLDTIGKNVSSTTTTTTGNNIKHEPICAISCFRLKSNRYQNKNAPQGGFCILIATRNFFYQYLYNPPSTTTSNTSSCFTSGLHHHRDASVPSCSFIDGTPYLYYVIQNPTFRTFKEMPGYIPFTRLDLYYPNNNNNDDDEQTSKEYEYGYPKTFAWLTKPGIFYGEISPNLVEIPSNEQDENSQGKIFDDATVIMYNNLVDPKSNDNGQLSHIYNASRGGTNSNNVEQIPLSLALTKFHLLLLYPFKMKFVCTLSQQVIQEDRYLPTEPVEGMAKDPIKNTIWFFTKYSVYRYKIYKEDRNIWEIFLKKNDFQKARKYAKGDFLKMDRTICEEALFYFSKKEYKKSAQLFTQTRSKSFEEIALKFIELRDHNQDALKMFLMSKLSTLSTTKGESAQIIILLVWIFEIMLNQLVKLKGSIQDLEQQQQQNDKEREESLKTLKSLKAEYSNIEQSLKHLISDWNYRQSLKQHCKIIYDLILNHHNQEIYEYFATKIDDFECLIEHYCRRGEYDRALRLMNQEEFLDLYYKYSPVLIKHLPKQLIDCLIPLSGELDFSRLIPSLVHFDHQDQVDSYERELQCKEILRFLEYCIYQLKTRNHLVHNYFLALLIQFEPEQKLLRYIQDVDQITSQFGPSSKTEVNEDLGDTSSPSPPYDLRYAIRICMQSCKQTHNENSKLQRCPPPEVIVQLLTKIGAYEEAVDQALSVGDVELAKRTANAVQVIDHPRSGTNRFNVDNMADLSKRLWLKIAKHVIKNIYSNSDEKNTNEKGNNQSFDISMATSILNECSMLKIEDILPYFPEYLTIDHFKQDICQSLEEYNRHIESLREDMKMATESAQQIREEIVRCRMRYTIIDSTTPCSICSFPAVQEAPFYSFPSCGHLFHHKCLIQEILEYLNDDDRIKLEAMLSELKSVQQQTLSTKNFSHQLGDHGQSLLINSSESSISITNRLENLNMQIEDLIGRQCLFCGDLMIQTIDKPFIDPVRDGQDLKGWN